MNKCIFCNSAQTVYIRAQSLLSRRNIFKCTGCGIVSLENYSAKKLDDTYWNNSQHIAVYEDPQIQIEASKEFIQRLKIIEEIIPKGRILDIGCGIGVFLRIARQNGWNANGVEVSTTAARYAREKYGLNVHEGSIETCQLEDENFDACTLWDVIEHIENPIIALREISHKIRKGGLLIIKTPNELSLYRFLARAVYRLSRGRITFLLDYAYYVPHYFYYDKHTIVRLLQDFGFEVARVEEDRTDYNFAKEKIKLHFRKFSNRKVILMLLPAMFLFARFFRIYNKMVVYAVKT